MNAAEKRRQKPDPGYTTSYVSCANYSPTSPCYGPCNCTNCAAPLDQPAAKKAKVVVEVESDSANKVSDLYPKTSELARARLCDTCKQDRNLNSDDIECSAMCDGTGEEYTAHNSNCECDHHQGGTGWTTAPTTDSEEEEEEEEPVRGPSTLARDAKKKMAAVADLKTDYYGTLLEAIRDEEGGGLSEAEMVHARQLWPWFKGIDGTKATHVGGSVVGWDDVAVFRGMSLQQACTHPEFRKGYDFLACAFAQYNAFTGRASRSASFNYI